MGRSYFIARGWSACGLNCGQHVSWLVGRFVAVAAMSKAATATKWCHAALRRQSGIATSQDVPDSGQPAEAPESIVIYDVPDPGHGKPPPEQCHMAADKRCRPVGR